MRKHIKKADVNTASLAVVTLKGVIAQLKAEGVSGGELKSRTKEVVQHMHDALNKPSSA